MSAPTAAEVRAWADRNLAREGDDDLGGYSPHELILPMIDAAVGWSHRDDPDDVCVCGHVRRQHIYGASGCRPGFVCAAECRKFRRSGGAF